MFALRLKKKQTKQTDKFDINISSDAGHHVAFHTHFIFQLVFFSCPHFRTIFIALHNCRSSVAGAWYAHRAFRSRKPHRGPRFGISGFGSTIASKHLHQYCELFDGFYRGTHHRYLQIVIYLCVFATVDELVQPGWHTHSSISGTFSNGFQQCVSSPFRCWVSRRETLSYLHTQPFEQKRLCFVLLVGNKNQKQVFAHAQAILKIFFCF